MGIKWFWRSRADQAPAALHNLAIAVTDAGARGSLSDLAFGLVQLALDGAQPDEALRVLSAVRPRTWLRLDVELRSLSYWLRPGEQWRQLTDAARAGSNPLALLLTACTGDGRLRQRAVMTPLMCRDQRLLPLLLIRTADWVKQVRRRQAGPPRGARRS